MNLIEEVLKVEANYRSALDAHMASGSFRTEAAANNALGRLKDVGRTAAPKLARALEVAMEGMRYLSRTTNEAAPIWCSDFIDTGNGPSMRFVLDSMKCEIETILNEGEPK